MGKSGQRRTGDLDSTLFLALSTNKTLHACVLSWLCKGELTLRIQRPSEAGGKGSEQRARVDK